MNKKLLLIFLLLTTKAFSQNLVNNPGFEIYRGIPTFTNSLNLATGWSNCNGLYFYSSCCTGTPDYYSTLASGAANLPYTQSGYIEPHGGQFIVGLVTWDGGANYREYIRTFLTSNMVVGRKYIVSFYVSLAFSDAIGQDVTNNIGINFSKDTSATEQSNSYGNVLNVTPQINITSIVDTNYWKLYQFLFTADSTYKYLTLGNFYDDAHTIEADTFPGNSAPYGYYYFDDFSVIPLDISNDTAVCSGSSVTLFAHSFSSYAWSTTTNPNIFSTDSIVTVTPTTNTNYIVSGNGFNDTIKVTLGGVSFKTASQQTICSGNSVPLQASGASSYTWSPTAGLSATTGSSVIANPTTTTTYIVIGSGGGGCTDTIQAVVTVNPTPNVQIVPNSIIICTYQGATLVASGADTFQWHPIAGLNTVTGDTVVASPTVNTTYTVVGILNGCTDSAQVSINLIPAPNIPSITVKGDTLISSAKHDNQWFRNDSLLNDDTSQYLIINPKDKAYYFVEVSNPANGCSTNSDSTTSINQLSAINEQLSIYPNPTTGSVFIKIKSSVSNVADWNLQITDVLGRLVYKTESLDYLNEVDMNQLPPAMYFITITDGNDRAVFKVVKQE